MVKDRSDSEKGNPLPPHGLLFPISSKVFFYIGNTEPACYMVSVGSIPIDVLVFLIKNYIK